MRSMSARSDMAHVWHYDGTSAIRHVAELQPGDDGFTLRFEGDDGAAPVEHFVRWADLTARGMRGTSPVYGLRQQPGWQIGFPNGVPDEIAARLPRASRFGGIFDRFGVLKVSLALGAVSALVVALVLQLPDWIAPHIPMSMETRIGETMTGKIGSRICKGPGGEAALAALVKRVDPQGDVKAVHVVNTPLVNAVTLPGGTILVFDGLLHAAKSPDELAGVLGHEFGHVRHRDVMQAMVRQLGLSVLLGGFGGNMGGNINSLLSASYSRAAEAAADDYAIAALKAATVTPTDTAAFFNRLGKTEESLGRASAALAYLSTHPISDGRAARFSASLNKDLTYRPALDRLQWDALVDICNNDPARKNDKPFDFLQ